MIARLWTARASTVNARRYAEHLRDAVLPVVQRVPGYAGATLLERRASGVTETGSTADDQIVITVITWWRSEADIRAFAGDHITRAVVTDEARGLLTQFDDTVRHFEVTLEDRPDNSS
jgi:heme-degrading monooxygenase HmoA